MFTVRLLVSVVLFLAEGIFEVLRSVGNLEELEERIQQLVQKMAGKLLVEALEQIDGRLARQRDQKVLESVDSRKRTLVTSFGEITFRRRYYRNAKTGSYHFLLDEAMGLEERRRLTPRMAKLGVELGTEMPFRRAARIMEYLVPGVSALAVWSEVQKAGERAQEEAENLRAAVFDQGVIPQGQKTVEQFSVEGDGVLIPQQQSDKSREEVKVIVGYEGKEGPRRRLKNRHTVAGTGSGEEIWEEASAVFGFKWSLDEVKKVRLGGDGAEWIKGGLAVFPQASYHLDRFHLRKRLTEALAFSSKHYEAVSEGIYLLDREVTVLALDSAIGVTRGAVRKRIWDFKNYLLENWDGIAALPEEERLGVIEGQVRHTIARRMKRIGARWTPGGTDRMSRLLAARANDELERYVKRSATPGWAVVHQVMGTSAIQLSAKPLGEDPAAWLEANVPALEGPFASAPWVKYVLKTLTSMRWSTV